MRSSTVIQGQLSTSAGRDKSGEGVPPAQYVIIIMSIHIYIHNNHYFVCDQTESPTTITIPIEDTSESVRLYKEVLTTTMAQ